MRELVIAALVGMGIMGGVAAYAQRDQTPVEITNGRFHRDSWQGEASECWLVVFTDQKGRVQNWQLRCVPKGRGALSLR